MKAVISLALACLLLGGCASQPSANFYYGRYVKTLYAYKKEPTDENRNAHIAELKRIITESNQFNMKVPPGIHAELGEFLLKSGDAKGAIREFKAEETLFPESAKLMNLMIESTKG